MEFLGIWIESGSGLYMVGYLYFCIVTYEKVYYDVVMDH
jgi:hypothetical protein